MPKLKPCLLVVDDEENLRQLIKMGLEDKFIIIESSSGQSALENIVKENVDIVLLDVKLPDMDGLNILKEIKNVDENFPVIMLTADNTVKTAVVAMKHGAYDYITKPFDIDILSSVISKAFEIKNMHKENNYLKNKDAKEKGDLIGESIEIKKILSVIDDVSESSSTVLIYGETGTGKELVARQIHKKSTRRSKLFVPVNCAGIPDNLLESELFGHERGSFSGALERHIGKFELAHGGTLFLDEAGSIPHPMQAKLLRVLQDKIIERIGGERPIAVDTRIISASNIDLKKAAKDGKFREDLYYRLNVIPIFVPPLRERKGDIEILLDYFLKKYNAQFGKSIKGFTKDAMVFLNNYSWPGNIRELKNLMERLVVLGKEDYLSCEKLPFEITNMENSLSAQDIEKLSLKEAVSKFEKDLIRKVLEKTGGNRNESAKLLGIHRNTLLKRTK